MTTTAMTTDAPQTPRCKQTLRRTFWIDSETVDALNADGGPNVNGSILEGLLGGATVETTLKHDDRSHVDLLRFAGRRWVHKRVHTSWMGHRLGHMLRRTPVWREWNGARKLRAMGRRVAAPLMLVHDRKRNSRSQTLIFPYVEGATLDKYIAKSPPPEQRTAAQRAERRAIAEHLGRQIGALLAAGIVNRDHKPSNLVVDARCRAGEAEPVILDVAGLRIYRDDKQVYRMLAVLWRSATRAGDVSPREGLRCLYRILKAEPTLANKKRHRLKIAARGVESQLGWRDDK